MRPASAQARQERPLSQLNAFFEPLLLEVNELLDAAARRVSLLKVPNKEPKHL